MTQAMAAFASRIAAGRPPDLFLTDHDDLTGLIDDKAVRRVDDLLADREVDFGDGYTRTGLEAFSADAALQCMPADVSPLVVYYNPTPDRPRPHRRARPQPGRPEGRLVARGVRPRRAAGPSTRASAGSTSQPDLEQVAPFIWSGGGEVVDDSDEPTTLTLSEGASADALEKLLELVRDPALTFNQDGPRAGSSALERFEAGKLGMILGYRDLTPRLRAQQSLTFDVMPLPRLSGAAPPSPTMSGLCISAKSEQVDAGGRPADRRHLRRRGQRPGRHRLRDAGQPRRRSTTTPSSSRAAAR